MNGFLLCTIFLTWQTSLLHPSSRASSFKLLLAREALSSTILSFVILSSSNLLWVVLSSPIELSTPRSSLMNSFLALFVKLVVLLSSIVCAHRSCWSFWAFWGHNPVKQLLHFVPVSCWLADLLIGPPTAFPLLGTGVPWVSLPGPTGVMTHPGRMMSHQRANPILLLCTGVPLHWLHSWRVHLQHYQTWPMLCTSYDAGKSNQIETWLDVTCMAGKLNWSWHAPLSHASTLSHSQSVFSRSSTRSLRPVSVFLSLLVLWGSHGSWFASSPVPWLPSPCWRWKTWSSTCVCSSVSPCLDLTSSVLHWSRASWSSSSLSSSTFSLPITLSFLNFCFSFVFFLIVLFECISFLTILCFDYPCSHLSLFSPFTYLPVIPKSTFFWTISVFAVSFFWKKRKKRCFLLLPVFSTSLRKTFFSLKICVDSFWNFRWFFFKKNKKTLHFHLHQCNTFPFWTSALPFNSLLLFIFYPIVLFFWSLRVFPFLSPFFRPFWIFHWSWLSLCFLYR